MLILVRVPVSCSTTLFKLFPAFDYLLAGGGLIQKPACIIVHTLS